MSRTTGISDAAQTEEMARASQTQTAGTEKKRVNGRTIGNPQLSEKASKYYEELKKKYSNMDFILVSNDQKEMANAQAAKYANPNKMVVLIDEEKIEKMASDEKFRKQYEGIISNGANSLAQMAKKLTESGANVKGFGMQVKDGRASFFAAVDKSFASQRERQQKRIAQKRDAKKAEAKKAEKKAAKEKLEEKYQKRGEKDKVSDSSWDSEEYEIISASSIEELVKKVEDYHYASMSDRAQTEQERQVGQSIDYSV
ncbi:MAG: DUF6033 family protein [Roseburia sp.]|nr:DUF6033 family protein [Roseburia sp.]